MGGGTLYEVNGYPKGILTMHSEGYRLPSNGFLDGAEGGIMKRLAVLVLLLTVLMTGLSAAGFTLGISGGSFVPVSQWRLADGQWAENGNFAGYMGDFSAKADLSFGYSFNDVFELGLSSSFEYVNTSYVDDLMFIVPAYVDMSVGIPVTEEVRLPLSLSVGGYAQFLGSNVSFGPAVRLSAGVDVAVSELVTLYLEIQHELLFTLRDGFRTFDMSWYMVPVVAGMRLTF